MKKQEYNPGSYQPLDWLYGGASTASKIFNGLTLISDWNVCNCKYMVSCFLIPKKQKDFFFRYYYTNRQHHAFWLLKLIRQFQSEVMEDLSKILSLSMKPFPSICLFADLPNWHYHHIPWFDLTTAKITEGGGKHITPWHYNLWATQTLQPKHLHCGRKPISHCNSFLSLLSVAYRLKRRIRHFVKEA